MEKTDQKEVEYIMSGKELMINKPHIIDDFLTVNEFIVLREEIFNFNFSWNFSPIVVHDDEELSPGGLTHLVYNGNAPLSQLYNFLNPTLNKFKITALWRIQINLLLRLPEPFYYQFHSDTENNMKEDIAVQWTTSILYINTNNGYTEFEDGTKVESVANRLVSFPSNTRHRAVTQTDEQRRIVINMVYLKRKPRD